MIRERKVLMLGPSLTARGGVASVERSIISQGVPGFQVRHIETLRESSNLTKLFAAVRAIFLTAWHAIVARPSLAHVHFASRSSFFRKFILTRPLHFLRIPLVVHAHGAEFEAFWEASGRMTRRMIVQFLSEAQAVVALSESWAQFFRSITNDPTRVKVLMNPVNLPNSACLAQEIFHIRFLYMGRIGARKGTMDLVRACAHLHSIDRGHPYIIQVLGDGDKERLMHAIERGGCNSHFKVQSEWVSDAERDQILSRSHVLVLPSHSEGLPMSILEAMANGLAIITTPVGGIPELVDHGQNGLLVDPGDPVSLARAMAAFLEEPSLAGRFGRAGRERVATLNVAKYCERLAEIYQEACSEKGS